MYESINFLGILDYISIILIIFIGVPHGAFDASIGMTLGLLNDWKSKFIFIISYVIIAIVVVLIWYVIPKFSLLVFLLISIFHFGLGDTKWTNISNYFLSGYFNGGLVIFGISFLNFDEVDLIYKMLINDNNSDVIWHFLKLGGIIWLITGPIHLYYNYKDFNRFYIIRIIFLIFIIYFTPPLVSFTFYFCFIHSVNHVKRILPSLKNNLKQKNIRNLFLTFTFLSWFIGIFLFFYLIGHNALDNALIKLTFIGLAALTFPHMILIDIIFRPKTKI